MIPASGATAGLRLVHRGRTLAGARVAATRGARRRGLLGVDVVEGVLVLRARSVHTIGMRIPIDVASCSVDGRVRRVRTLVPGRVGRPIRHAPIAIEAAAGAFSEWGIVPGDVLELVA